MFLFYGFDYSFYICYFNELFSTTQSWALETNLQQYSPFLSWGSNTYSNLPWLLLVFVIVAVLQLNKGVSPFKILGCFFLVTISVYMVFKRGGGASYLDAIVIITLLISLLCAYRPSKRLVLSLVSISLSGIIVWVIAHIDSYGSYKGNLPGMSAGLWQKPLYDWNRVHDLPIIGIFPDNSFVTGTMEDMMMRGFSNFGKPWGDSILNPSKIKLFPKYTLGSTTMTLPDKAVVLWLTSTEPFPLVNKETLDKHNSEINVLLFNKKVGPCISIIHPIYGPEIRSCVVSN